jgi:ribonuclease-3
MIRHPKIEQMLSGINLEELEEKIGYKFKYQNILIEALTHPSLKRLNSKMRNYQRLEFLGDKVLGLVISEYLFKNLPDYDEGILSKKQSFLVSGALCLKVATQIGLDKYILTSETYDKMDGECVSVPQSRIMQNVTESIIGAMYIDSGSQKIHAERFIIHYWTPFFKELNKDIEKQDPKTALQEWYQKLTKKVPEYKSVDFMHEGNLYFEVSIHIEGYDRVVAIHTNRKVATKIVAAKMLQILKEKGIEVE